MTSPQPKPGDPNPHKPGTPEFHQFEVAKTRHGWKPFTPDRIAWLRRTVFDPAARRSKPAA